MAEINKFTKEKTGGDSEMAAQRINGLHAVPFPVLEAIYRYQHFIILGHQKPDADCATSQIAMCIALKYLNKSVDLVSAGPFLRPEICDFAPKFSSKIDEQSIAEYGRDQVLAIILDCSTAERTGFAEELKDLHLLIIDHHASGEVEGDFSYCDPQSPSTSMLVNNLLLQLPLFLFQYDPQQYAALVTDDANGTLINQDIAQTLFLGFATDTGFFRFLKPENAGDMLRLVSVLVDTKISLQDTYQHMTGGRMLASRRILGLLLLRAGFLLEGKLCVSYELLEDKEFWQAKGNDSDSFYSLSLATQDCEAIVLIDQSGPQQWNVGLRSLKQHDVGSIAANFGGGGHRNAAGCRCEASSLTEALETLLTQVCLLWDIDIQQSAEIQDYIQSAPSFLIHEF